MAKLTRNDVFDCNFSDAPPYVGAYITELFEKNNEGKWVWNGQKMQDQLLASAMNDYIFWALHVSSAGDLSYNSVSLVSGGMLSANTKPIKAMIEAAKAQGVSSFFFSIGGWGVSDWQNIETILNDPGGSNYANLIKNLTQLVSLGVTGFDFDYEEDISDPAGIIALMAELLYNNFRSEISFCPYTNQPTWLSALQKIYSDLGTQPVVAYNLQCYSGGSLNVPSTWISSIDDSTKPVGVTNAEAFVRPGRPVEGSTAPTTSDPTVMGSWLVSHSGASLSGAWIWNAGQVVKDGKYQLGDYACAIQGALGQAALL